MKLAVNNTDLVIFENEYYQLNIDLYGNPYRYDKVLNTIMELSNHSFKQMLNTIRIDLIESKTYSDTHK